MSTKKKEKVCEMKFGSVCSGIEAASVAWLPLGWEAAWLSEISAFPSAVLAHHYPNVPNYGDMCQLPKKILSRVIEAPDILVGGTPCQSFSVAGRRASLDDARGNLTLKYVEIIDAIDLIRRADGHQPAIAVWENVPGVLSTKDNAFGCFIGALAGSECELQPAGKKWANAGCVYGPKRAIAWRVLNAQYFGLAQRRRRVFVVASAGAIDPSQVLFEFGGVRGDFASSASQGQNVAGTLTAHAFSGGAGGKPDGAAAGHFHPVIGGMTVRESGFGQFVDCVVSATLKAQGGVLGGGSESLVVAPFDLQQITSPQNGSTVEANTPCPTMSAHSKLHTIAIRGNIIGRADKNGGNGIGIDEDISPTLTTADRHAVAFQSSNSPTMSMPVMDEHTPTLCAQNADHVATLINDCHVRRLTPTECERLQGFPDGYTDVPFGKRMSSDAQRYFALGNSMAVPVVRWIGERIEAVKGFLGETQNDD